MKKKTLIFSFVAAALALALSACGAKPAGIALGDGPLKVAVGGTAVLEPEFTWEGEAPAEAPVVAYTSADEAVATVDESGVVTGVAAGETTITATAGEVSATREVVVNVAAESLTVEEMSLHLADGAAQAVVAVEPAELADQLTFKTGDDAVATIDETGLVTPVKEGHTALLILAPDGTRGRAMITVWSGPKELHLECDSAALAPGGSAGFTVTDEAGEAVDPASLSWTSSDEAVLTVDAEGQVTAVGAGEATVTAQTKYEISASAALTVEAPRRAAAGSGSTGGAGGGTTAGGVTGPGGGTVPAPTPAPAPAPDPAPQPEPQPDPVPEVGPDGNPVGDSPTVDLDPDAGNDVTLD